MESIDRRTFLRRSAQAAAVTTVAGPAHGVTGANEKIRIACVGIGGRGGAHIREFLNMKDKGVEVAALCDIDKNVLASRANWVAKQGGKKPDCHVDMRKLMDDKNIDAVSFATPNHWHALGTIWGCQANKDVYVEKPASWCVREGRKMVEAAEKYKRIVQVGMQSRSNPGIRQAVAKLHAGLIGEVYMARMLCYKRRDSIGFRPIEPPPKHIDFGLWLGPAPDEPYHGNLVHYNWHWFWNFGNGDIGNQGVHEVDKARWGLGKTTHPVKVSSMGGRYTYKDQGQTPNTQIATCTYEDGKMLVMEVRGRYTNDEAGEFVGNLFYGSQGWMAGWKEQFTIRDQKVGKPYDGKPEDQIKLPPVGGAGGSGNHFENFIVAVRSRKVEDLNAPVLEGHLSCVPFQIGNIAYRLGRTLEFDPKTEKFVGSGASEANPYLTREYRKGFEVPEQV